MLAQDALRAEQLTEIQHHFAASAEWLLSFAETNGFAIEAGEIELKLHHDKLVLSAPTARGWQHWIVQSWQKSGEKLIFQTARKLLSPAATLEFTPRVSIGDLRSEVKAARLAKAAELAELARKTFSNRAKIERVSLSQSNRRGKVGTIARVLLKLPNGKSIAVCGSVVPKTNVANLLANSIFWFAKFSERRAVGELWLVADNSFVKDLQNFWAILRNGWRERIKIYRLDSNLNSNKAELPEATQILTLVENVNFTDLWRIKPKRLLRPKAVELSQTAQTILELAPDAIDVLRTKKGETLRFHGLPFVRIREILGAEQTWFGANTRQQQILNDENLEEFSVLLDNLRAHRNFAAADKRHAFYRAAPESWLESMLRRDVSRLDPNLILAPLYAQFRLSNKKGALDLLAVRSDGRLVVIELKTTTDREHVFQAAGYWRQIEQHRRSGNIGASKLFGKLPIADAPPLVYLVAPLMSFHRDYEILANTITREIEIWRFDLNEDWRSGIRVARRTNPAAR